MTGGSRTTLPSPTYVKVFCHGQPYHVPARNPRCPLCGKKLRVVW